MPSTRGACSAGGRDYFGVRHAGAIYGLMILGWSLGGIIGPVVISWLIGSAKSYTMGFTVIAVIALASMVLTVVTRVPRTRHDAAQPDIGRSGVGEPSPSKELVRTR